MPRFADAIGYLLELRDTVGEAWFHAVCDMAVASTGNPHRPEDLEHLHGCFHGSIQYTPAAAPVSASPSPSMAGNPAIFLQQLSGFNSFKKLSPTLTITFARQLTVVFGKNGSGKSSLCQALKVLANSEQPAEPLHNVRATTAGSPAFTYKFRAAAVPASWTLNSGFGTQSHAIKYFDSTVAVKHATGSLQPRTVVEITAFRLEVLDYARQIVSAFQTHATSRVTSASTALQAEIDIARQRLASVVDVTAPPFDAWAATSSDAVRLYLERLQPFDDTRAQRLTECQTRLPHLVTASSDSGLAALRAQHALLEQMAAQLSALVRLCGEAPLPRFQVMEIQAIQKRAAIEELAKRPFPPDVNTQHQHGLITAAAAMYDLSSFKAGQHLCPLCTGPISATAQSLFAAYHGYLTSNLQTELAALDRSLQSARSVLQKISAFQLSDFSQCRDLLPAGAFDAILAAVDAVARAAPPATGPLSAGDATAFARSTTLADSVNSIRSLQQQLAEAIATGTRDRQQLMAQIAALNTEIASLKALQAVWSAKSSLMSLCLRSQQLTPEYHRVTSYDFTSRLRAMTNKGKDAHKDLVLGTFEQLLSGEYSALCGATLEQMGVRLSSRGEQQDIIVTPQVGAAPVHRVLSEGEQKVHALAVFMCEAMTMPARVLVFDDPVTSFDYNYVSNFCERIRDLVRAQPATQVIVLTHNWDFFINLQSTVNRSPGLNARMAVQVLEDCATVREYSENWDELCRDIAPLIAGPNEPTAEEKERLAGLMRRLLERLTNKHVFYEQRHQYKQKNLSVSNFHDFTKLVALQVAEADALKDLFSNLSPPEHDDPRNFYTSRSRAQFKTWFDRIISIRDALDARRP